MANLKEIRNRIGSINSTMQITSAMKMVSAAKLRRAQDAVIKMRPYSAKLSELLQNVSSTLDSSEGGAFAEEKGGTKALVITITSNRGLCGAFNANVLKAVKALSEGELSEYDITALTIGKKAYDILKKTSYISEDAPLELNHSSIYDNLDYDHVSPVAETVIESFLCGDFDKVYIVFNRFKNAAVQELMTQQFLPILPPENSNESSNSDYIYEPEKTEILEDLIPKSLKTQLYSAILDSYAAEHGARMTAMHKATDNAGELLKDLKLTYNKARQAAITTEILEIVGGAEALDG